MLEPQVGENRGLIDVTRDLLGAALGRDMLGADEWGTASLARELEQVTGHQRDGPARTPLPRRVGGRVDHDLTNHSPTRVVGIAAGDEKARKRLGDRDRARLGSVAVEMAQRRADVAPVVNRPGELQGRPARPEV